jgi:hypothetical protein
MNHAALTDDTFFRTKFISTLVCDCVVALHSTAVASETWTPGKLSTSMWRSFKCGAGGEWRR